MSRTLWGAGDGLTPLLDAYTVGEDRLWDRRLLAWDVYGTIAHVEGLAAAGILGAGERRRLVAALRRALREIRTGTLTVTDDDEDVHTAVERYLGAALGAVGAKVHTGRSRNDQVITDLRLYAKDRLLALWAATLDLAEDLVAFAANHRKVVWPGYTHQRRAMPSTVGLWAAGFAEALVDDLAPVATALDLVDRSPLGSAAGFGVPLPLDREETARRLGFRSVQNNVQAVQASRGKLEVVVLSALWTIAHDLGKLAWDVILFSSEEFGFLRLPRELATGSSIMPHKKNPDVFELTRAREGLVAGWLAQAVAVAGRLPSGYHRDLQLTKGPFMRGLDAVAEMVAMTTHAVGGIEVDEARCGAAVTGDLLATDEVYRRVRDGVPFRTAYREVAAEVDEGREAPDVSFREMLASRPYPGGAGNLALGKTRAAIRSGRRRQRKRETTFREALAALAGGRRG